MYEIQQTREEAALVAELKGCVCRVPSERELFLDLDSQDAIDNFGRLFASFLAEELATYKMTPSPSGKPGRVHVVVTLDRAVEPLERITLQAVLGSDPMRELLNWRRLVNGVPHDANNILFEKAAT